MANKFSEFLAAKKIDQRRLLVTSAKLEKLRPEDRAIRLARRNKSEESSSAAGDEEKAAPAKPRSGRPVTGVLLDRIAAGKPVSGAAKTRVLRAVNAVLEQKKQEPAQLKDLF